MLNIISKSYSDKKVRGPKKVVENLIKGLDILGYPYVINKSLDSCRRLWIHDDNRALRFVSKLKHAKVIAGPNISFKKKYENIILLQPSVWSRDFCVTYRYNDGPVDVWAAGIDTTYFSPSEINETKEYVLIYYKKRSKQALYAVIHTLEKKHLSYKLIVYGEYQEKDYLYVVQKAKYVIWVGCAESQGIALQETLACNVPILVWDVEKLGDWQPKNKSEENFFSEKERKYTKATSAPYFSQRCGIVFISEKKLNSAIETMEQKYNTFHPRSYVVKNLSLEVQAYAFLTLYEKHYSMSIESGFSEKLFDNKNWITNHVIDKGLVSIEKMLMYLRRE